MIEEKKDKKVVREIHVFFGFVHEISFGARLFSCLYLFVSSVFIDISGCLV